MVQAHPAVVAFLAVAEQPFQLLCVDVPFLATLLGVLSEDHGVTSHDLGRYEVAAAI
ncbi:hypothetical protein D3C81_2216780 [compost metagenome]